MQKINPPTYFFGLLVLLVTLHFLFPLNKILFEHFTYFGLVFVFLGIVLNLWADSLFTKTKTMVKPNQLPAVLLQKGPFAFSRHPMYLGMALILFGSAIFFGTISTFLPVLIFVLLMEKKFIPLEEKNLEKVFGKNFFEYKKKVRKWI